LTMIQRAACSAATMIRYQLRWETPCSSKGDMPPQTSHRVAIRVPIADPERIDELAAHSGLSRSQYLIRVGVGELVEPGKQE
jgi:hypothetical protein